MPFRAGTAHIMQFWPVRIERVADSPPHFSDGFSEFAIHHTQPFWFASGGANVLSVTYKFETGRSASS
jgi:hypothetical protein